LTPARSHVSGGETALSGWDSPRRTVHPTLRTRDLRRGRGSRTRSLPLTPERGEPSGLRDEIPRGFASAGGDILGGDGPLGGPTQHKMSLKCWLRGDGPHSDAHLGEFVRFLAIRRHHSSFHGIHHQWTRVRSHGGVTLPFGTECGEMFQDVHSHSMHRPRRSRWPT